MNNNNNNNSDIVQEFKTSEGETDNVSSQREHTHVDAKDAFIKTLNKYVELIDLNYIQDVDNCYNLEEEIENLLIIRNENQDITSNGVIRKCINKFVKFFDAIEVSCIEDRLIAKLVLYLLILHDNFCLVKNYKYYELFIYCYNTYDINLNWYKNKKNDIWIKYVNQNSGYRLLCPALYILDYKDPDIKINQDVINDITNYINILRQWKVTISEKMKSSSVYWNHVANILSYLYDYIASIKAYIIDKSLDVSNLHKALSELGNVVRENCKISESLIYGYIADIIKSLQMRNDKINKVNSNIDEEDVKNFLMDLITIAENASLEVGTLLKIPLSKPISWETLLCNTMYIRRDYEDIYSKLTENISLYVILGTAGIGKSTFILYYILKTMKNLMNPNNEKRSSIISLYIGSKNGSGKLMLHVMFEFNGIDKTINICDARKIKPDHILIDSTPDINVYHSFEGKRYKLFIGSPGAMKFSSDIAKKSANVTGVIDYYQSPWSISEVNELYKNDEFRNSLIENNEYNSNLIMLLCDIAYKIFGGSIRFINDFMALYFFPSESDEIAKNESLDIDFINQCEKYLLQCLPTEFNNLYDKTTPDSKKRFIHMISSIAYRALHSYFNDTSNRDTKVINPEVRLSNIFCHLWLENHALIQKWSSELFLNIYIKLLLKRQPPFEINNLSKQAFGNFWENYASNLLMMNLDIYTCKNVETNEVVNLIKLIDKKEEDKINVKGKMLDKNNLTNFKVGDYCQAISSTFPGCDAIIFPNVFIDFTINSKHAQISTTKFKEILNLIKSKFYKKNVNNANFKFVYVVPNKEIGDNLLKVIKNSSTIKGDFEFYILNMGEHQNICNLLKTALEDNGKVLSYSISMSNSDGVENTSPNKLTDTSSRKRRRSK